MCHVGLSELAEPVYGRLRFREHFRRTQGFVQAHEEIGDRHGNFRFYQERCGLLNGRGFFIRIVRTTISGGGTGQSVERGLDPLLPQRNSP